MSPSKLSPHELAYIASTVPWTPEEQVIAVAVALAESGGDTDAIGPPTTSGPSAGNRDHGLWQISGRWHGDKLTIHPNWRNGYVSARLAYQIFVDAGRQWTPWHVFTSGAYQTRMAEAQVGVRWPFKPATLGDRL